MHARREDKEGRQIACTKDPHAQGLAPCTSHTTSTGAIAHCYQVITW